MNAGSIATAAQPSNRSVLLLAPLYFDRYHPRHESNISGEGLVFRSSSHAITAIRRARPCLGTGTHRMNTLKHSGSEAVESKGLHVFLRCPVEATDAGLPFIQRK
jgi:hypothetical protein